MSESYVDHAPCPCYGAHMPKDTVTFNFYIFSVLVAMNNIMLINFRYF